MSLYSAVLWKLLQMIYLERGQTKKNFNPLQHRRRPDLNAHALTLPDRRMTRQAVLLALLAHAAAVIGVYRPVVLMHGLMASSEAMRWETYERLDLCGHAPDNHICFPLSSCPSLFIFACLFVWFFLRPLQSHAQGWIEADFPGQWPPLDPISPFLHDLLLRTACFCASSIIFIYFGVLLCFWFVDRVVENGLRGPLG